jgi:glycogen debranching enzyme
MIRIDFGEIRSPEDDREWLDTDGRGGYASSTLQNCHTRRYHGLLVANLRAPEGRYLLLSKLEDSLQTGGEEYFFSSHRYPGVLFPPGPPILEDFLLDLCPRFTCRAGRTIVKKSILMPHRKGILLVRYDLDRCPKGGVLRLKPFLAFRGYHKLTRENPFLCERAEEIENGFRIEPYEGMPPLFVQTSRMSRFTPSPVWYNRFQYTEERKRGFDWEEDLFLPGSLEIPVERKCTIFLSVSWDMMPHRVPGSCTMPHHDGDTMPHHVPMAMWKTEVVRRGREQAADKEQAGGLKISAASCGESSILKKNKPYPPYSLTPRDRKSVV